MSGSEVRVNVRRRATAVTVKLILLTRSFIKLFIIEGVELWAVE